MLSAEGEAQVKQSATCSQQWNWWKPFGDVDALTNKTSERFMGLASDMLGQTILLRMRVLLFLLEQSICK